MKKMKFCPNCNLKMRKVTLKKATSYTTPDGSSFGMFTDFTPIKLGGHVVTSQKVVQCPRCRRQIPLEAAVVAKSFAANAAASAAAAKQSKKAKKRKNRGLKIVLGILAILLVLAIAAGPALYLWNASGHMPSAVAGLYTKLF